MAEYCNSCYCKKADKKVLYNYLLDNDATIELIEGCKREYIVQPFRIVKNLFKENVPKIFENTFSYAYNDSEYGKYIVGLQCNKDRKCYCFGIDRTHLGPPADVLTPD